MKRLAFMAFVLGAAVGTRADLPRVKPERSPRPVALLAQFDAARAEREAVAALGTAEAVAKALPETAAMTAAKREPVEESVSVKFPAMATADTDGNNGARIVPLPRADGQESKEALPAFGKMDRGTPAVEALPAFAPLQGGTGAANWTEPFGPLHGGTESSGKDLPSVQAVGVLAAQKADPFVTEIAVWGGGPLGNLRNAAVRAERRGDEAMHDNLAAEYLQGLGTAMERQRVLGANSTATTGHRGLNSTTRGSANEK